MVVSNYRLVKIRNSPQFLAQPRKGTYNNDATIIIKIYLPMENLRVFHVAASPKVWCLLLVIINRWHRLTKQARGALLARGVCVGPLKLGEGIRSPRHFRNETVIRNDGKNKDMRILLSTILMCVNRCFRPLGVQHLAFFKFRLKDCYSFSTFTVCYIRRPKAVGPLVIN